MLRISVVGAMAVAIILLSSTFSFAGNFTPIPKNKVAQIGCSTQCENLFNLLAGLRKHLFVDV